MQPEIPEALTGTGLLIYEPVRAKNGGLSVNNPETGKLQYNIAVDSRNSPSSVSLLLKHGITHCF